MRIFKALLLALLFFVTISQQAYSLPEEISYSANVAVENQSVDDTSWGPFNIGFSFTYFGTGYTTFYPTSNGLLCFGSGTSNYTNGTLPSSSIPACIAAFWDDLYFFSDKNTEVLYQTIGTAPNRKLIVQFNNVGFFGRSYLLGTYIFILNETTNTIQVQYRSLVDITNPRASGNDATLGLNSSGGSYGLTYSNNVQGSAISEKAILYTPTSSTAYTSDDTVLYEGVLLERNRLSPKPTIPKLLSPEHASTVSASPTFVWEKPTGVTSYRFKITREDSYNDGTHWATVYDTVITDPNQTTLTPEQLETATQTALGVSSNQFPLNATFYWAVFAENTAGSTWSEIHKFTTSSTAPLTAVGQTVWASLHNDKTIQLMYTGGTGEARAAITSLPAHGSLYQYIDGARGAQITAVPTTVTDSSNQVIYINDDTSGTNQGNFNFSMTDEASGTDTATITIHVSPPAAPQLSNALIISNHGNKLLLKFSKAMTDPTGKHSQFTVTADGVTNAPVAAALSSTNSSDIYLSLTSTLIAGQSVRIVYTEASGTLTSTDGGVLGDLDTTVTVPAILQPTDLTATAVGAAQIDLAWTDNSSNETGFEVYRATSVSGTYSLVATTAANATSYSDTGLSSYTPYFYKVRATDGSTQSDWTDVRGARTFKSNLRVTGNAIGSGTISPAGATEVLKGRSQAYTMTADSGSHIADVLVDGVSVGAVGTYTFNNIITNHTITVQFEVTRESYPITANATTGGSISPSGVTSVADGDSQAYTISADSGYHISDVLVDGASVGAVSTYTFSSVMASHTISAQFVADAASYVITATTDQNGTITPSGATSVTSGESQTYTIVANSGYHIGMLTVDGVGVTGASSYTFSNVTKDHTISVSFEADSSNHIITANSFGPGAISPSGNTSVVEGASQSYTMTADSGAHLVNVVVDGRSVGALTSYSFVDVESTHTISATFAADSVSYVIASSAGDHGSISPSGSTSINAGESASYSITPDSGYHVATVSVDGVDVGQVTAYTFSNVQATHSIQCAFAADAASYTITATAGTGGSISPSGTTTVTGGASQTFTITASSGYHLSDVKVNSVSVGAVSTYTVSNVGMNYSVVAYFEPDASNYIITANALTGGSISPSGAVSVTEGNDSSYSITPNSGYHVADVVVDGVSVGAVSAYTFANVYADHTITASFAQDAVSYSLTANAGSGGTISPAGVSSVNRASSQSYTITANTGYHIADVVVDSVSVGTVGTYVFNNVQTNHVISATFAIDAANYVISATAGNGGSVSPAGATTVTSGNSQSYTISANSGYHIVSVTVDGVSQGAIANYTFSNVRANHTISVEFAADTATFALTANAMTGGTISPSGVQNKTAGTDQSYSITADSGYHISDVKIDSISVGTISAYTFSNINANHTIVAYFEADAVNYTITANASAGGAISPSGAQSVARGATQSFTITPDSGYRVTDVLVDSVSVGSITGYTFSNVQGNHTISASFAVDAATYNIVSSAGSGGTISPLGDNSVTQGANATFQITPTSGYHVVDVFVDGVVNLPVSSYTFVNVQAAHTLRATFAADAANYTILSTCGEGGTISPAGEQSVASGNYQSYSISPLTGYHVVDVQVDGSSVGAVTAYTFSNMRTSHTISASFALDASNYVITSNVGTGGTISPSGATSVARAGSQSYTITADSGYHVTDVTVDGVSVGAVSSYIFSDVQQAHEIFATFALDKANYAIAANSTTGGSITPSGNVVVAHGGSQVFTFTPDSGYHLSEVWVDGESKGAIGSYTLSSVVSEHIVYAVYVADQASYTITSNAIDGGTISPSGTTAVAEGANKVYTITPNSGYHIVDVFVDGRSVGAVPSYIFTDVKDEHSIDALFQSDYPSYDLTSSTATGGTISPLGVTTVTQGNSQTYSVTADTNFHITKVYVNGSNKGPLSSYTFSNVRKDNAIKSYFVRDASNYILTSSVKGGGTVSPSGQVSVARGGSQSYTITPNTGYHITGVYLDGAGVGKVTNYVVSNVQENRKLVAQFVLDKANYNITAVARTGGTISSAGVTSVAAGGKKTYTITADTGYHVTKVYIDGWNAGAISSYTFKNLDNDHTITAEFAPTLANYKIIASAGSGGTVSPSTAQTVVQGGNATVVVSARTGYKIKDVVVDGESVGAVSAYTFSNVRQNHALRAVFSKIASAYSFAVVSSSGGSVSPSGTQTVNRGNDITFSFTPTSGYHVSRVYIDGVSQGELSAYTFDNVDDNHAVFVNFEANAASYVVDANAQYGGSISPSGRQTVLAGQSSSYTITPSSGFHIKNVTVDGESLGEISAYTFSSANGNHSITATFEPTAAQYTVTATAQAGGVISPVGIQTVTSGASLALTITPDSGYHVSDVLVDGQSVGNGEAYLFNNVTADHTIAARFVADKVSYTVTGTVVGGGAITPSGPTSVTRGDDVIIGVVPDTGYHLSNLVVDGVVLGAVDSYVLRDVQADHLVKAEFALDAATYTVTTNAGTGGSISPSGSSSVARGGWLPLTITPATGYRIDDVVLDGRSLGALGTYTLQDVQSDHSIAARFVSNTAELSIVATAGQGGTISSSGSTVVTAGQDKSYTITPSSGYHISDVKVDGESVGALSVYSFFNVTRGHTINAQFASDAASYSIGASAGVGGSISPVGLTAVTSGNSQSYSIVQDTGYHIADVKVDGVSVGAVDSYTFVCVQANHTIAATFALDEVEYSLTANASVGGSISPTGVVTVDSGSSRSFTMAANTGYHLVDVMVDGISQGVVSTYTFSGVQANHSIYAQFVADVENYVVTANALGGGTISPSGIGLVSSGDNISYDIAPNSGYHVVDVLVDGKSVGDVTTYTFSGVSADHSITASFAADAANYVISSSAGNGGSISPAGTTSVTRGATASFNIDADPDYRVSDVTVDGSSVGAVTSYTFDNIQTDHRIVASFVKETASYVISASVQGNGSLSPSGAVVVTKDTTQSFEISANSGYHVSDVLVDGVSVGVLSSYTFSNVDRNHDLVIKIVPDISQYIITANALSGGVISPNGATTVSSGQTSSYEITPATNYHIQDVVVDGVSVGAVSTFTFSAISADHMITAKFAADAVSYVVSAVSEAGGSVSPAGNNSVVRGDSATVSITPDSGYHIADVTVDGQSIGAVTAYTFTDVQADHSLRAKFAKDSQSYSIIASASFGGAVEPLEIDVEGAGYKISETSSGRIVYVQNGNSLSFSILPVTGFHVARVTVDGASIGQRTTYTFSNVAQDHSILVYFEADAVNYYVTANALNGGAISPSGVTTAAADETVSYAITADSGYHIRDVIVDGESVGALGAYTFSTINSNHTITAQFEPTSSSYTVSVNGGQGGSVSPTGAQVVNAGDSLAVTVTPSSGYHIVDLAVDGASAGAVGAYVFSNVQEDHSIYATFARDTEAYVVTASAESGGSVSLPGANSVTRGDTFAVTITPDSGFHISEVVVDGASVGAVSSYVFVNVQANHSIVAKFVLDASAYTVTTQVSGSGAVSPTGASTITRGGAVSIVMTANAGYRLADLVIDGQSVGALSSYTFTNVQSDHEVTAEFVSQTADINIIASAGVGGSISDSGITTLAVGSDKDYTITPNSGYHIVDVKVDGKSVGVPTEYFFGNVTKSHTVDVKFAQDSASYLLTPNAGQHGAISPASAVSVAAGGTQSFTITPDSGYHVIDVLVDGQSVGRPSAYTFSNVQANGSITVTFAADADNYTITPTVARTGTITPAIATAVTAHRSQTFSFTPNAGYHVIDVLVDSVSVGARSTYTFSNVITSHTIEAVYGVDSSSYAVTSSASAGGSISPLGSTEVLAGANQAYSITPDSGYHVAAVYVDGKSLGAASAYVFSNIQTSHTIRVLFARDSATYTITPRATGSGGTISPSSSVSANAGSDVAFRFDHISSVRVKSVLVDGYEIGPVSAYTFSSLNSDHTIEVIFEDINPDPFGVVGSPAYAKYNTYLNQQSYIELSSTGTAPAVVTVTVYNQGGRVVKRLSNISIAAGKQRDILIESLVSEPNSYGLIRIDFNSSVEGVSLRGRVVSYRELPDQGSVAVSDRDYAFAMSRELRSATLGTSYVRANSIDPNDFGSAVINYLELVNLEAKAKRFKLNFYNESGKRIKVKNVTVAGHGELDVMAGHDIGVGRFLVQIIPGDQNDEYMATLARYAGREYGYSVGTVVDSRKGASQKMYIPLTNDSGQCWNQSNELQIANTLSQATSARVKVYNNVGKVVKNSLLQLSSHQQRAIDLTSLVRPGFSGFVSVTPSDTDSIIVQNDTYYTDCNDQGVQTGYSVPAIISRGKEQYGSFNTYLGTENILHLTNLVTQTINVNVKVKDSSGRVKSSVTKKIAPHDSVELNLGSSTYKAASDSYGTVEITSSDPNQVLAHLVRRRDKDQKVDFAIVTAVK